MSSNMQRLGSTLANRMKQTSSAMSRTALELGTINSNLSLTTDSLAVTIPKGDYMVNIMLAGGSYNTSSTTHTHSGGAHTQESGSGAHTHDGGDHSHRLPDSFRSLQAGDRVLVAWCGNEPVVIAIVTGS